MIIKESLNDETKQVAYISSSDLKDAYPVLFRAYKELMDGKNPKISLYVTNKYSYTPTQSRPEMDYYRDNHYLLYQDGKVLHYYEGDPIETSPAKPGLYLLEYGEVAPEFSTGHYAHCYMYVNSSTVNQLSLEEDKPLDLIQEFCLGLLKALSSSFRKKEFFSQLKYGSVSDKDIVYLQSYFFSEQRKEMIRIYNDSYKSFEAVCLSLQGHGLVKISSNGATALTMEGKNYALKLGTKYVPIIQAYHQREHDRIYGKD